jgi:hypothetical protein
MGGSVINNDSIDGKLVTTSNTDVARSQLLSFLLIRMVILTVLAGTTAVSYSINYTICETGTSPR